MFLKRFRPYFAHLKTVRLQFAVGLLAGILAAAASGAGLPLVIEYIVPKVSGEDAPAGLALLATLAIIPGIFAFRALGTFLNAYYMAHAGMHVLECLRLDVFKKLQSLPLAFFQKNNTGDLMARIIGDTLKLQVALVNVVNSLIKEPATLVSAIGVLVYLSFKHENAVFMLIALASVPGCVLPIKYIGKRLLRKAYAAQKQAGLINDV
ncbi:MAG: ABC transporter transmembrane domain-containing protein, partial [Opitutales bacterium]